MIIDPVMRINQKRNGSPISICAEEAIATRSAPILIVFAITSSKTVTYSTRLE